MEHMFQEYSSWRGKLEQIEVKMKADVEFWRQSHDKVQKENDKLHREILKAGQQVMEKTKEIEAKQATIEKLQKAAKQMQFDPVEEVVCPNCRNSLEDS